MGVALNFYVCWQSENAPKHRYEIVFAPCFISTCVFMTAIEFANHAMQPIGIFEFEK